MVIKGYRVGPLLKKVGREIMDDNLPGLAAETAYYFFFSLFPLLLFIAPFVSLVGDKQAIIQWTLDRVGRTVPGEAMALLEGVLRDVVFAPGAPSLMSVGALLALWTGSNVFNALIDALNRAYDVTERRPWWKKRLLAIAAVIVAGACLALATTVMLAGEQIVRAAGRTMGLGATTQSLWLTLQYPLALSLLVGVAWLLFYFLPNVRQDKTQVLAGAIVTTLLWVLVTLVFRAYVQEFGNYNKTYGTIGAVIVLLTWMYLSMLVVLVGGELNAELHLGTGAVSPRSGVSFAGRITTTTGPGRASTDRIGRVQPLTARGKE